MKTVDPLPLEPGHYQTIINQMKGYLSDKYLDLVADVDCDDSDSAMRTAQRILATAFWVEDLEEQKQELLADADSAAVVADASAKMFRDIGKAIQENEVTE